ncbi:hypothetical protein [Stackebrandtia soli]|uniref:hypothetical protein n=1 Tax=Stackebrandtia soli TaxID=1892856 RepID=UPI0039ED1427
MNSGSHRGRRTPDGRRSARRGAVATAALLLLASCQGTPEEREPSGSPVEAEVLVLENGPDGSAAAPSYLPPVIADTPIDPLIAGGWAAAGADEYGVDPEPRDPFAVEVPPGQENVRYVAWRGSTGCYGATDARLARDGDDLLVTFTAKDDSDINCEVLNYAYVQFAVDPTVVDGVATVNGVKPVDGVGPGVLVDTIDLGEAWETPSGDWEAPPTEITEGGPELHAALEASDTDAMDEVTELLNARPEADRRRFAFVLHGCEDAVPALVVTPLVVTAELGDCTERTFVLAVFDVDAELLPPKAELGLYGRADG